MKLILGTVQFGLPYGINNNYGKPENEEIFNILHEAFKNGIDELDTAEAYGTAHQAIGSFHKYNSEISFKVVTKFRPTDKLLNVDAKITSLLGELNVNYIEAILFHSFDSYIENKEIIPKLEKLKAIGLIKHIGVSVYNNEEVEYLLNEHAIDVIQIPFNILDNSNIRGEILVKAKKIGKIIHTRSTFLQGLFFMDPESNHPIIRSLKEPLKKIHKISHNSGLSIRTLSLCYCAQQPYIDKILIGVENRSQLNDNIESLKTVLPDSIIKSINKIKVDNINKLNPSQWKY